MDSVNSKTVLGPNVFVPMNESQMEAAKGGDDCWQSEEFLQMMLDWVDEQTQDPTSVFSQVLSNFGEINTIDEGIWEDIADDMEAEGLIWPDAEAMYEMMFMGGNGPV